MYQKLNLLRNYQSSINTNGDDIHECETIEMKIERIMNNGEGIDDSVPIIYTEKTEGVIPMYNIRTDKFETLIEAKDALKPSNIEAAAERSKKIKAEQEAAGENKGSSQEQ